LREFASDCKPSFTITLPSEALFYSLVKIYNR